MIQTQSIVDRYSQMDYAKHDTYMNQCFSLAARGLGNVAPNPLVGSLIVYNDSIIGEGYHETFGGPHAEVNAINSIGNQELLKESTLYVNLEPCSHQGKTPPCVDLIISKGIKRVVIANEDPFPQVAGKGIAKLRNAGIEVITETLEEMGAELNKRFFSFYQKSRPYIILKWAQTDDGFIAPDQQENKNPLQISNSDTQMLVHQWRSEEQAILVGKETILKDDPELNVRLVKGKSPIPFILGLAKDIPADYKIHHSNPIFFGNKDTTIEDIKRYCLENKILSILVEGGTKTLQYFIDNNFWDEARVITNINMQIGSGVKAPKLNMEAHDKIKVGSDMIQTIFNPSRND